VVLGAMPWAWDWSPSAWAAIGACATFLVYVLIGVYAVRQVGYARRQVDEARQLREEQARPWVVIDFEVNFLAYVTIQNFGRTVATEVRVRFDPPLESTLAKPWAWEKSSLLRDGIPTLPPGKKLRLLFDSFPARVNDSDLPMIYTAEAEYDGFTKDRHKSTYRLDLNYHVGASPEPKGLPEIAQTLDNIQREMHKWTDGHNGIRANVVDRDKDNRRDYRPIWIQRANTIRKEKGLLAFGQYLIERWLQRRGWIR